MAKPIPSEPSDSKKTPKTPKNVTPKKIPKRLQAWIKVYPQTKSCAKQTNTNVIEINSLSEPRIPRQGTIAEVFEDGEDSFDNSYSAIDNAIASMDDFEFRSAFHPKSTNGRRQTRVNNSATTSPKVPKRLQQWIKDYPPRRLFRSCANVKLVFTSDNVEDNTKSGNSSDDGLVAQDNEDSTNPVGDLGTERDEVVFASRLLPTFGLEPATEITPSAQVEQFDSANNSVGSSEIDFEWDELSDDMSKFLDDLGL